MYPVMVKAAMSSKLSPLTQGTAPSNKSGTGKHTNLAETLGCLCGGKAAQKTDGDRTESLKEAEITIHG
jgi:hypothetical protein